MPLFAIGLNHETADLILREKAFLSESSCIALMQQFKFLKLVEEIVILSTCNRTEIYIYHSEEINFEECVNLLSEKFGLESNSLNDVLYFYREQDVVRHILRVASGLDSMVVGEPQIFGQLKIAVEQARNANSIGPQLSQLLQHIFRATKSIRTQLSLNACPVSIASTTVDLAMQILNLNSFIDTKTKILLIGTGQTINLVARYLIKQNIQPQNNLIFAGRDLGKTKQLAQEFNAKFINISEISQYLNQVDLLISATASPDYLITADLLKKYKTSEKNLILIDIAVPRDIDPEIKININNKNIILYDLDDLKKLIDVNLQNRFHAAEQAEKLIIQATQSYFNTIRVLAAGRVIHHLRQQAEQLRDQTLNQAYLALQQNRDPQLVLKKLAHRLTNQLVHLPSVKIRKAASLGHTEWVEIIEKLFTDK